MIIYLLGDIYGDITQTYKRINALAKESKLEPKWILQTGNFGAYPDPLKFTRQMRKYGHQDFSDFYFHRKRLPYPTLFVSGKHDDNDWLELKYKKGDMEILGNLHWLVNGYSTFIGDTDNQISVCGLGKVFSQKSFVNPNPKPYHYTLQEVQRACGQGPIDILITHQTGYGEQIGQFKSLNEGIQKIIYATNPKIHIHSGYNTYKVYTNKVGTMSLSLANNQILALDWYEKDFKLLDFV